MSKHKNRRRFISSETTGLPDKIYSTVPIFVIRLHEYRNHDQWNLFSML